MENSDKITKLNTEALQAINPFKKIYSKQMIYLGYIGLAASILLFAYAVYQTIRTLIWAFEMPLMWILFSLDLLIVLGCVGLVRLIAFFISYARPTEVLSRGIQSGAITPSKLSNTGLITSTEKVLPFNQVADVVESKNLFILFVKVNTDSRTVTALTICPKDPDIDFREIAEKYGIKISKGFHQDSL